MQPTIPLYTADRQLYAWITEQRMVRLERLGLIHIIRHRKGRVARCVLYRRAEGPKPVRLTNYLGRRYSFRERLDNGCTCWSLRPLDREELTKRGLNFAH